MNKPFLSKAPLKTRLKIFISIIILMGIQQIAFIITDTMAYSGKMTLHTLSNSICLSIWIVLAFYFWCMYREMVQVDQEIKKSSMEASENLKAIIRNYPEEVAKLKEDNKL